VKTLRKKRKRNVLRFNGDRNVAQQPEIRKIHARFVDPAAFSRLFSTSDTRKRCAKKEIATFLDSRVAETLRTNQILGNPGPFTHPDLAAPSLVQPSLASSSLAPPSFFYLRQCFFKRSLS